MAFNFRKILAGLNLVPKTTSTVSTKGDLDVTSSDGKLNYHDGTAASPLVTESRPAILTNKTIDADQNTLSNIENADIKSGAAIDRTKLASGSNDHVLINNGSGVMSSEAILAVTRGGTGQSSVVSAFDALSPLTTKGDVLTRDNSTSSRLPVGTDGQVLTADSTQSSGIKWGNSVVANNSIDETKLTTSVAGNGLNGGNGTPLGVNVDSSTIEISSDTLQVKNAGITRIKQASVGEIISASCGTFSTTSSLSVNITNLSVTIVTTGRPVIIGFRHDELFPGVGGYISVDSAFSSSTAISGALVVDRDSGTKQYVMSYGTQFASASTNYIFLYRPMLSK